MRLDLNFGARRPWCCFCVRRRPPSTSRPAPRAVTRIAAYRHGRARRGGRSGGTKCAFGERARAREATGKRGSGITVVVCLCVSLRWFRELTGVKSVAMADRQDLLDFVTGDVARRRAIRLSVSRRDESRVLFSRRGGGVSAGTRKSVLSRSLSRTVVRARAGRRDAEPRARWEGQKTFGV